MGKKTRFVQICIGALLVGPSTWAESRLPPSLDLVMQSETSQTPLTTAEVWRIAPEEYNPHLVRWVLDRRIGLKGLRAVALQPSAEEAPGEKTFGIAVDALVGKTIAHLRQDAKWFRSIAEFPCLQEEPALLENGFATREGTENAAKRAIQYWESWVEREQESLLLRLAKVRGRSEVQALQIADYAFLEWSQALQGRFNREWIAKVRKAEWAQYVQAAAKAGYCNKAKSFKTKNLAWSALVEKPPATAQKQLVLRAPAKRTQGGITVRLTLQIFEKNLNGIFFVDPSSPLSYVSPDFLERQGIETDWLVTRGVLPKSVPFRGQWQMAQPVVASQATLSGTELEHWQFWMVDTEVNTPPRFKGSCCDGVIGMDLLRKYAAEIDPKTPAHLTLWSRSNFSLGSEKEWKPVRWRSELAWKDWPWSEKVSILDLSNGRWWFPEGTAAPSSPVNRSGLKLEFREVNKERSLRVVQVARNSSVSLLSRSGLRVGSEIEQINGFKVTEMDQWQVDEFLSGKQGRTITLEWKTAGGPKIAPFSVMPD